MTSPAPAVASVAAAGLARRLTWLMLVRTLVISAVLGLSPERVALDFDALLADLSRRSQSHVDLAAA